MRIEQPKLLWLKILLPFLILIAGVGGAWWLIIHKTEADEAAVKKVKHEPPTVKIAPVQPQALRMIVHSQGVVAPKIEIDWVPEVSGKVVKAHPNFAPGGYVKKSEILAEIDARDFEFDVIRARAAVAEAQKELLREREEAAQAEEEWKALGSGKAADYVLHKPQLKEREAKLVAAEADLAAAQLQLARCRMTMPFNGWIRDKRILPGHYLTAKQKFARLYADDSAEVKLPISTEQVPFLNLPGTDTGRNNQVILTAQFGDQTRTWQGRIARMSSDLDEKNALLYAIAEIPHAFTSRKGELALMPGLYVKAEIEGIERFDVVSIPKTALYGGNQVYSVDQDNKLKLHRVDVLRHDGDRVILGKGLEKGDRIMVGGLDLPVEGMKVKVSENTSKRPSE